tara:strand:- start:803 stop:2245 length:1443 start_codon:yes stop_codon:yes gene_type:complete
MKNKIKTTKEEQNTDHLLSIKNKYFAHLLYHQNKYFTLLLTIIFLTVYLSNYLQQKLIIYGTESYYLLASTKGLTKGTFMIKSFLSFLPEQIYFFLPLTLAFCSVYLFLKLFKTINLPPKFTSIYLLLLLITPAIILTITTISTYAILLILILIGFFLLTKKNRTVQYLSLVPFILSTTIDLLSSLFLLGLLFVYFYAKKSQTKTLQKQNKNIFLIILTSTIISWTFLKLPLVVGPFVEKTKQSLFPNLITDLGGISGMSFFMILLAFIGIAVTWKRKNFYLAYLFLPLVIVAYIYNTQAIFHLTLTTIFFASFGIIKLFEQEWTLKELKKITFFILCLGLLFSTITYLDRIDEFGPSNVDLEMLTWIKNNVPENKVIFTDISESYFVNYFSEREVFYSPHQNSEKLVEEVETIINSTYIKTTFPLLQENNLSLIYLTEEMNLKLPQNEGLLFLLKNERFKMVHSQKNYEVWIYEQEQEE